MPEKENSMTSFITSLAPQVVVSFPHPTLSHGDGKGIFIVHRLCSMTGLGFWWVLKGNNIM